MRAMRRIVASLFAFSLWSAAAAPAELTEAEFRAALNISDRVTLSFRDLSCKPIGFAEFAAGMREAGVLSETVRAPDGSALTVSLHRRGGASCPSPYGRVAEMPAFDLLDLAGKPVKSANLRGKPTLINFYFAQCKPCILEVGPLNRFAASRSDLNFLAMTFDEPAVARAFVQRFKFHWRVVPDATDFINRMAVNRYPMMALFDARGRLLGMRAGGVKDELEAATVEPALRRWVDNLLRAQPAAP
jgi:hypothetical protein